MTSPADDPFAAFDAPRDPLADAHGEHAGVAALRGAVQQLDDANATGAAEAALRAWKLGVPAELAPYLAVVGGVALFLDDKADAARTELERAWADHPDVAALPAALGAIRVAGGDDEGGAQVLYAALVSDDPDRSLAIHRRRLTLLLGAVRGGDAR